MFYNDNLHVIEKGYLTALSIKKKINFIQHKFINTKNTEKIYKSLFNTNYFPPLPSKPITNKQDYSMTINTSPRNYNTDSTSGTIKVYVSQSQTKFLIKKSYSQKRKHPFQQLFRRNSSVENTVHFNTTVKAGDSKN